MVVHAADGWEAVKRLTVKVLIIGSVMGGVQYFVVVKLGLWNIGSFVGGMAGLIMSVAIAYWGEASKKHARRSAPSADKKIDAKRLFIALSAYLILILFTVGILLAPPLLIPEIKKTLGEFAIQLSFPETVTSTGYISPAGVNKAIPIFTHTGAILLYSSAAAFVIYKRAGLYTKNAGKKILNQTARKMVTSSLSIALMVAMAVVMQQSGMTEALAQGLAKAVGVSFPFFAAWIGALGAFMTGSNTNSNVLFAALQMRTSELLGYSVPIILAAQTAGASVGSVLAPAKLIVGASTAGMEGKEGIALRAVIAYGGGLIFFISLLTLLAVTFQ